MAKKASSKPLKKLKYELNKCYELNDKDKIIKTILKIIEIYPNNSYGYIKLIEYKTNNFRKYIKDEELKEVKDNYAKAYDLLNKNEKESYKASFDDYLYDIKEVNNLSKIKKNIISKYFMKELYNGIFQSLNIGKLSKNMKIKNVYSLINGLIFIICFAYNLLYRNLFLILTIPLGIFGIVNVLTYFDKRIFSGKRRNNVDFEKLEKERLNLKIEIKKTDDSIFFHTNEKITSLSKIPESFKENLTDLINDNEEDKAKLIFDSFCENNYVILSALLDEYTNLKIEDINNAISNYLRSDIKLNNKSNILYIKKIKPFNYVLMILLIIISIISVFLMIKNNYLYHIKPLVSAILIGLLKTIIYSDYIEEKISIMKIFFKITKTSLFSSSLIYDIIYMSNVNNGNTKYMLLVIPFTFLFLFSGFNMIISYMKYNKLLKKIRKY